MSTCTSLIARRASVLSLALAAALPAFAGGDGGLKETCVKPAPGAASAPEPEAKAPLTTIDIVLVTADFKKPGLVEEKPDEEWTKWKLDDINRLAVDRLPKVLKANGLDGKVIVLPAPAPGDQPDFSSLAPDRPALVFVPTKYSKWRNAPLAPLSGGVTYAIQYMNAGEDAPQPKCRLETWGGVGADSVWGLMKTNQVDAEWVDTRLTGVLTMMARQGVVKLDGEKAVRPAE